MEIKKNECQPFFNCGHTAENKCIYHVETYSPNVCALNNISGGCCSNMAQVNIMILELKKHGIEIERGND